MEELASSYQVRPTVSVLPGVELIKLSHVVNARMAASIWPWFHVWVLDESKNPWSPESRKVQSSKITNEFAKRLGMSEEQLFKCAAENTRRLFPPVVRSMNDIMREMFARDGMPQEIADMMIAEIPPEQTMWVISNEKGINGAASMLYENELHELAESLESDLYILPSSVHEVIAVSSDMGSPEMLAQMVVEVNMQEVSLDERLSNQVYHYDKDLRKLTLATDTPNKRLDGIVAEPPLVYDAKEKSR